MSNKINSYEKYLRIEKIKIILSKKEFSVEDIIKKTNIPMQTVYRITSLLLKHNVITVRKLRSKKYKHILYRVFKLKTKNSH